METYKPRVMPSEGSDEPQKATSSQETKDCSRLQPHCLRVGTAQGAAGSAYVEVEGCKVLCSVYGPRQSSKQQFSTEGVLWCDFKFTQFAQAARRKQGRGSDERALSKVIAEAVSTSVQLDKLPKSKLEAYVMCLEADSDAAAQAAAITCVSLAVANAGVEMYDLVAACSCAVLGGGSESMGSGEQGTAVGGGDALERLQHVMQPTASQLERSVGSCVLACMPTLNQVTHLEMKGTVSAAQTKRLMGACEKACVELCVDMRECLKKSLEDSTAS